MVLAPACNFRGNRLLIALGELANQGPKLGDDASDFFAIRMPLP
jgi:hypothetical protein